MDIIQLLDEIKRRNIHLHLRSDVLCVALSDDVPESLMLCMRRHSKALWEILDNQRTMRTHIIQMGDRQLIRRPTARECISIAVENGMVIE